MEEAKEDGALGSSIWALRGKLLSLVDVLGVLLLEPAAAAAAAAAAFKSLPVRILVVEAAVAEELLKETLVGGKLGGIGVESMEEFLLAMPPPLIMEWLSAALSFIGIMGLAGGSRFCKEFCSSIFLVSSAMVGMGLISLLLMPEADGSSPLSSLSESC